jgi:hypothetical protein
MIDRMFKYYVTITLLVITVMLLFVLFRIPVSYKGPVSEEDNIESLYFQNNEINGLMNNGLNLNDNIILFNSDESIYNIKLSELPPTLILRYSAYSCNHCIDYINEKINKYFGNHEFTHNVLIIASDYNKNTMKRNQNIVYLLNSNTLGLPIEKTRTPFVFLLENGKVTHLFTPERSFDKYTDVYFKFLKERYFSDKR